ncbi:gluconate:H+ symporter [Telmatospirillum siberiense]|uniref:Gluconate permease n=1 Tax=Telmatospirillum siberiense TaxID=382514 RepID=A0A2N3PYN9_9PROT|nr:gluconate:H+ symporter [Telmatospirillum siberiense]PKU25527.1 gluconate permease [Telmatospirillum siberiense]
MPILFVIFGVAALLFLIVRCRVNAFVSLVLVSFVVALALGIPADKIVKSIESGIGGTLGHIALIFGLGVMLGRLIADAGGAQRIAVTLIDKFGEKNVQWAVLVSSFIIGIALFFEVGVVLLIPIVVTMARQMKIPVMTLGVPMVAALITAHGFLPPHPGPTVVAGEYHADIGRVLVFGIVIAIPSVLLAGPVFTVLSKRIVPSAFEKIARAESVDGTSLRDLNDTPAFGISVLTAMLPVIMMSVAALVAIVRSSLGLSDNLAFTVIRFVGDASISMLVSLLFAAYTMGLKRNKSIDAIMSSCSGAVRDIAMMLLIIGGGGALKQVFIDGGVGTYLAHLFAGSSASPLLFAWTVAAILRIALGSATVAAISTVGLVLPMLTTQHVDLALVTLATGAGSATFSHVNDAGFWMVKESFGLTVKETFGTWSLLCAIVSVVGLVGVLVLERLIA